MHWTTDARVVELLAHAGAPLEARDRQGSTPLHHAAMGGHLEAVKTLVEAGANINAVNNYPLTPYMIAAKRGKKEIADYLLAHGAKDKLTDIQEKVGKSLGVTGIGLGMFGAIMDENEDAKNKKVDDTSLQGDHKKTSPSEK